MISTKSKLSLATLGALTVFGLTACQTTPKGPQWVDLKVPAEIAKILQVKYDKNSIAKHEENKDWHSVQILTQPIDPSKTLSADINSINTKLIVDCKNNSMRLSKVDTYKARDAQGDIAQTQESPEGTQFVPAKNEVDEELINAVCKK